MRLVVVILGVTGIGLTAVWLGVLGPEQRGSAIDGPVPLAGSDQARIRAPGSNLVVTISSCEQLGDSLWTEGMVRNETQVTVRYVEVALGWQDVAGDTVDSRVTFAIGGEVFTPGDTVGFREATAHPAAMECTARLQNYEPL